MLEKEIRETRAYYCLECGICTGSCPVSRYHPQYSPRIMVQRALLDDDESMLAERESWDCLTCGTCSARCPSTVDFNEFTRALREHARERGFEGTDTHAGVIRAVMDLDMSRQEPRDTSWVAEDVSVSSKGKVLFYTGCLPYYGVVFKDLGVDTVGMANSTIRLMNACGVRPVISGDERCCGHDMYWTGDVKSVRKIARENIKAIERSGARTVVFACPECYSMFSRVYPKFGSKIPFEMKHLSEFLAPYVESGRLALGELPLSVTYQDPCRLGRILGVYEAPRQLLRSVPGLELRDMPRARAEALCCGSSAWVGCTRINKSIQLERLAEARETGATTLVTGCPKCNIHLSCAARDGDAERTVEIRFLADILCEAAGTAGGTSTEE
jgi:heterodisulfide reductase subunit D